MVKMGTDAVAILAFKQQWAEVAKIYPVTNNDAALVFRALSDLAIASGESRLQGVSDVLEQLDRVVAQFPESLAPLLRQLAETCVDAPQVPKKLADCS